MALFAAAANAKPSPSMKLILMLLVMMAMLVFLLFKEKNAVSSITISPTASKEAIVINRFQKALPKNVMKSLVHYATSSKPPQQTKEEIEMSVGVLSQRAPCNFLVFGLGHDSLMWATLNHGGRTVFLEESEEWVKEMTSQHPGVLETYLIHYPTVLTEAKQLLQHARTHRTDKCRPVQVDLAISECNLALRTLPEEVRKVQWDVIMIDAPRGYFPEAPGRMSAIFSAAVMARSKNVDSSTDVFVHDVERPVEKEYCEEFLCKENLVKAALTGHLWHFRISPVANATEFCAAEANLNSA